MDQARRDGSNGGFIIVIGHAVGEKIGNGKKPVTCIPMVVAW
jgi:hypothetical protein